MFLFSRKSSPTKLPPLRFRNTLSQQLEDFEPLSVGEVKMYNCGPTVYGPQHIGNMRAAVFADLIRRTLERWDYKVKQVINITDVGHLVADADEGEDKMTAGLKREGMELTLENMRTLGEKYAQEYFHDIKALGVETEKISFPRASEYIDEEIALIKALEEKGYAYRTKKGVYFDVSRFAPYGKLGGIKLSGLKEGARVAENTEKRGPFDFTLWKYDGQVGFDSPWGKGFPGWHIECTAMIFKILGKQIDIHTGGIEHIPVHHNNEIAQAEAVTGKRFVKYWLHNDHITIEGKKIAKSLGNTVYVHNITDRGFVARSLRYWFLTAHYRSPANFTWDALEGANAALARLYGSLFEEGAQEDAQPDQKFVEAFLAAIADDLDTPKAIATIWDMVKDASLSPAVRRASLLEADKVLGLGLSDVQSPAKLTVVEEKDLPEEVRDLVKERQEARAEKNFSKADELRDKIQALGFDIKDTAEGPELTKRS